MGLSPRLGLAAAVVGLLLGNGSAVSAQFSIVQKVSALEGDFVGPLRLGDNFGGALANLGDINGDGVDDLAIGARNRDGVLDPAGDKGGLWLTEMSLLGTVLAEYEIGEETGGFDGELTSGDRFSWGIANLGAPTSGVLCDGFPALRVLAVGAPGDDDGGEDRGALWLLYIGLDRQVRCWQKISSTSGGFPGALADGDAFGRSVTPIRDTDGDGIFDLIAVGADGDDTAGLDKGAVWLTRITPTGSVISAQRYTEGSPGVPASFMLGPTAGFGRSVTSLDDLDDDGPSDFALAIGAYRDGEQNTFRGSVFILFFTIQGVVTSVAKITDGLGVTVVRGAFFGEAVAALDDLDGNGTRDLAIGAPRQGGGLVGNQRVAFGRVFVVTLNTDGTVATSAILGSALPLDPRDFFGTSVTPIHNAPQFLNLAVGARGDDDGGSVANANFGATWILSNFAEVE